MCAQVAADRRHGGGRRLTDRQSAILDMVADGLGNKDIAQRLGISEQAVKEHVSALLRRLAVPNRAGLADAAAMLRVVGSTEVSSEWMHLLFLHAPMLVALLEGPEHRFVAVNEAYRRAAGEHELVGRAFREAFPDVDETGIVKLLDSSFATGEPRSAHEVPARWQRGGTKDTQAGYVTTLVQPMFRADGTVGGVVFFGVDVTAEVRARDAARELADEREVVHDQLPSGVISVRGDGTITHLNVMGQRILGLGPEVVGGKAWDAIVFQDVATGEPIALEERPLHRALRGERVPATDYIGSLTATAREMPLRVSAAPLFDAAGKVRGAVAVFTPSQSQSERPSERSP